MSWLRWFQQTNKSPTSIVAKPPSVGSNYIYSFPKPPGVFVGYGRRGITQNIMSYFLTLSIDFGRTAFDASKDTCLFAPINSQR